METNENNKLEPIPLSDWILTLIVTGIPLVGFIMLFVWAFSKETHPSKANWAKALLLLSIIILVIAAIFIIIFGATIFGFMQNEVNSSAY